VAGQLLDKAGGNPMIFKFALKILGIIDQGKDIGLREDLAHDLKALLTPPHPCEPITNKPNFYCLLKQLKTSPDFTKNTS
jgi:hypothetical protein